MDSILDDGIVIIDKPPGIICHEMTTLVKKLVGSSRAGHAGTLDPQVSGVVPVAFGRATKLIQYLNTNKKTYIGIIKFKHILSHSKIEEIFSKLRGTVTQTPPKISAVRKVARKRIIHSLEILEHKERFVLFKAVVEAGTYIRTLCDDMGKEVGGARMEELRRTQVGSIEESRAVTLQELSDALWLYQEKKDDRLLRKIIHQPQEFIELPEVRIREDALARLHNGMPVTGGDIANPMPPLEKDAILKVLLDDGRFVGIGKLILDPKNMQKEKGCITMERMHIKK